MKQRVNELQQLYDTVSTAIKARSTALADTQRLVAKYEYMLHSAKKSLSELHDNDLMKRKDLELDLVSRAVDHRRQLQVKSRQHFCKTL